MARSGDLGRTRLDRQRFLVMSRSHSSEVQQRPVLTGTAVYVYGRSDLSEPSKRARVL